MKEKPVFIKVYKLIKAQIGNFSGGCLDEQEITYNDIEEFFWNSKLIAHQLLKEHAEIKSFVAGFSEAEMCHCKSCECARKLYGETKKEKKDEMDKNRD